MLCSNNNHENNGIVINCDAVEYVNGELQRTVSVTVAC